MKSITYTTNDGLTYTRVTKARARKLYNAGIEIGIHPCKLHPASPWTGMPVTISNKSDRAFDDLPPLMMTGQHTHRRYLLWRWTT